MWLCLLKRFFISFAAMSPREQYALFHRILLTADGRCDNTAGRMIPTAVLLVLLVLLVRCWCVAGVFLA
jgi:hypothetical protein